MSAKGGILSRVERYVLMLVLLILNQPDLAVIILAIFTYVTVGQRMYLVWRQYYHDSDGTGEAED
jgi:CDP-diacylglycerol--glycerol-3-phosphate 3-phosphatidyltransferase